MDLTRRNPCEVSREDLLEETQNTYGKRMNEWALASGAVRDCRVSDVPAVIAFVLNSWLAS